jgi:hypothetical protein
MPPSPRLHRPNIVIFMTDQERYPQYYPRGWAEQNLPTRGRLARHGLTFENAFNSTTMCSPSRKRTKTNGMIRALALPTALASMSVGAKAGLIGIFTFCANDTTKAQKSDRAKLLTSLHSEFRFDRVTTKGSSAVRNQIHLNEKSASRSSPA